MSRQDFVNYLSVYRMLNTFMEIFSIVPYDILWVKINYRSDTIYRNNGLK